MRNKKLKNDYHKKRQLLLSYDFYKTKHKKLPVSEEEYQELKDEILILENRYPSIKKIGDNLIIRATLTYDDGRKYSGAIKSTEEQVPHGHGFMSLNNDKLNWTYVGEFKDGVYDGEGEFISKGYYSYKGEWKKSQFNGKGKFINEQTNEVYEGEFVNDKKHGFGVLITANNWKVECQFKDNAAHGKGKITILKDWENEEKGTTLTGTFKKGHQQGLFEKIYPDGDVMDCMFVDSICTKAKFRGDKKWTIYKK
tara:strand:+ start:61 stop:819 length:759 start_codon:yes stop_codon:yes gene_type:complete